MRIYCPYTMNLGDFFNILPVLSGLSQSFNEKITLVLSDRLQIFNGLREFLQYQTIFANVYFRKEVYGFNENQYIHAIYSQEEFKTYPSAPVRPFETMRYEKFIRDNYTQLGIWQVDDTFEFMTEEYRGDDTRFVVADRWLHPATDPRRQSGLLKSSGLFDFENAYQFLDYTKPLMENASLMRSTSNFFGTFTGSCVLADLLNVSGICIYGDDMLGWNDADITYSFNRHFYRNRYIKLHHISELPLE